MTCSTASVFQTRSVDNTSSGITRAAVPVEAAHTAVNPVPNSPITSLHDLDSSDERSTRRSVVILGSTGSIGTQALEVIAGHQNRFVVVALAANGSNPGLLAQQIAQFHVPIVAVRESSSAQALQAHLERMQIKGTQILVGERAAAQAAACGADVVLNAINGSVGLQPSIAALASGAQLALANKESVVAGGHLLFDAQVRPNQINPVDSEHSAIWQSLRSGAHHEVASLILTASGGPFRTWSTERMRTITPEQALRHPTWHMGPVVTVNSSNMMNKGLEIIEASRLFDIPPQHIQVTVHPQSIVHSLVEFCDGATIAQMSPPDMKLPIALGLSAPDRLPQISSACDWSQASQWTFDVVNDETFPAVSVAREALETSENHTIAMNAANEQAVQAFLQHRLPYLAIIDIVRATLDQMDTQLKEQGWCQEVEQIFGLERDARRIADSLLVRAES